MQFLHCGCYQVGQNSVILLELKQIFRYSLSYASIRKPRKRSDIRTSKSISALAHSTTI